MIDQVCNSMGCGAIAHFGGYCLKCGTARGLKPIDKKRLGHSLYRSSAWKKLRVAILSLRPMCADIYHLHGKNPFIATDIDHIVPLACGGAELDETNLQPLCKTCHSIKTSRDGGKSG